MFLRAIALDAVRNHQIPISIQAALHQANTPVQNGFLQIRMVMAQQAVEIRKLTT